MKRVEIVIPAKNVGGYVYDCLKSCVLGNDDKGVSIHVVNDKSSDNTSEEIKRFSRYFSSIDLHIYQTDGIGPGAARNMVMSRLHCEYLIFLDGDDMISRRGVDTILDKMDSTGAEMCCPNIVAFDDAGRFKFDFDRPELRKELLDGRDTYLTCSRDNPELLGLETSMCMRIFRTKFYQDAGLAFSDVYFCEDVCASRKAFLLAQKVLVAKDNFYFYRLNRSGQRTSQVDASTMSLIKVVQQTMDVSLEQVLDDTQGGWVLSRLCDLAVWGGVMIPPELLNEYAGEISVALDRAPKRWWRALSRNPHANNRSKKFAFIYHKGSSQASKRKIIFCSRYLMRDKIAKALRRVF